MIVCNYNYKYITAMDFAEHHRKLETFQRIAKLFMVDSYEMDFVKGMVILKKVDEIHSILMSASYCLLVERWRWYWMIKVFVGVWAWLSICLPRPSFIKEHASSCKRYSCREKFWYCNIDDPGARLFRDPRK